MVHKHPKGSIYIQKWSTGFWEKVSFSSSLFHSRSKHVSSTGRWTQFLESAPLPFSLPQLSHVNAWCRVFYGTWPDTKGRGVTQLLVEQVSHHPPITAYIIENKSKGLRLVGHNAQKTSFSCVFIPSHFVSRWLPLTTPLHSRCNHCQANRACCLDSLLAFLPIYACRVLPHHTSPSTYWRSLVWFSLHRACGYFPHHRRRSSRHPWI